MILAFMIAYSYSFIVCRLIKRKWECYISSVVLTNAEISEDDFEIVYEGKTYWEDKVFKFAPPLYHQRYAAVQEKLGQLGPFNKVVDLGSSELNFFNYIKHLSGVEEILFVDQDEDLLKRRCGSLKPLLIDHLKPRDTPLVIKVLSGNAAVPDANLAGTTAVVAIELIEHMFPPDLDRLPYTLFGILQPQVVIITTPNSEFNVLFELTGFRHWDHKFEWTRRQFKDWVENVVVRFPAYSSKLYGVGRGPDAILQYGPCTQMVVFEHKRSVPKSDTLHLFVENSYHVISEYIYPFEPKVEIPLEEHVRFKAEKFIWCAVNNEEYCVNDQIEIPLSSIMRMVTRHSDSQDFLQAVLEGKGWTVEENKAGEKCVVLPSCGIPCSSSSSRSGDVEDHDQLDDISYNIPLNNWAKNEGEIEFSQVPEEIWSDHEDDVTIPPSHDTINHIKTDFSKQIDRCNSNGINHLNVVKGCDSDECETSNTYLCDKINHSCKLSSFNEIREKFESFRGENTSDLLKKGQTFANISSSKCDGSDKSCNGKSKSQSIDASNSLSNLSCDMGKTESRIMLANASVHSEKITDLIVASSKESCSNSEHTTCKSDSLDVQQKIENESLDVFDESHITCHNMTKKDICSVKRSLDLPLDSVKVNFNGNFERSSSVCKRPSEARVPQFSDISENKNFKGNSKSTKGGCISGSLEFNSSNASKMVKVGPSSSSLMDSSSITLDVKKTQGSDCRDKVDTSWGQNQSGINRCLSLQHIKEKEGSSKSNRFSLCCEKENINICDIFKDGLKTKSCGHSFDEVIDLIRADTTANFDDSCSQSKAVDSGYPNTSDRDMDMDLTPEQVDELLSENESSPDEREEEEEEERGLGGAAPIQILDHVENGDVANNNRDGEGNNLDQEDLGQPINFQQIIREEGNGVPLDDAPSHQDSDSENEEKFMSCASLVTDATLTSDDTMESERMKTCMGWLQTSTPCHSRAGMWRSPDVSLLERRDIAASSTSLEVHPPTSTISFGTMEPFPSWLLGIEIDDAGDSCNNSRGEFSGSHEFSSHDTLQDEDWSEAIVREDVLGGGEPHTEL